MKRQVMNKCLIALALPLAICSCSSKSEVKPGLWRLTEKATGTESSDKTAQIPPELAAGSNSATSIALCWGEKDIHSFKAMLKDANEMPKECQVVQDSVAGGKIAFEIQCKGTATDPVGLVRKVEGTYTATTFKVTGNTTMSGPGADGKSSSVTFKSEGTAERVSDCKS